MLSGRIKNLHNNKSKMFATIEYDDGNKLIFYDAIPDKHIHDEFSIGEKVYFEEKTTEYGIEAKSLSKIIEDL